eukprot:49950-Alexandrium_andersonii.AAC.1
MGPLSGARPTVPGSALSAAPDCHAWSRPIGAGWDPGRPAPARSCARGREVQRRAWVGARAAATACGSRTRSPRSTAAHRAVTFGDALVISYAAPSEGSRGSSASSPSSSPSSPPSSSVSSSTSSPRSPAGGSSSCDPGASSSRPAPTRLVAPLPDRR